MSEGRTIDPRDPTKAPPPSPHRPKTPPPLEPEERGLLRLEIAAVLGVGPLARAAWGVLDLAGGPSDFDDRSTGYRAIYAATSAAFLLLVILLGLRSSERERFGLVRPRAADVPLALGIDVGGLLLGWLLVRFVQLSTLDVHHRFHPVFRSHDWLEIAITGGEWTAAHASASAVCVAYLVPRLARLGWHPVAAVLAAAALQAGTTLGAIPSLTIEAFATGVVGGVTFLVFPRLTPVVLAGALAGIAALSRTVIHRW